ncbi:DNA-binding protein [Paenibacillus lentus]|uniref:DNA-binding protein n=1 Tax=Paenibacillus lentus TaxID=1338368 RepID=A0A3S8RS54_9BACL|nr:DNA-binding protein [Paenibacillus lentus]AZK45821.1 DNA-binding protein [Paenibacillus lentus]
MSEHLNTKDIYLLSEKVHPLDKAFELFRVSYKQNNWSEAKQIANYMYETAYKLYQNQKNWDAKISIELLNRPLVFYYGYSHLAIATVFQKQGFYDKAREFTEKYTNLDWFIVLDQEGQDEVRRFNDFAKANFYAIDLLSGKMDVLGRYSDFIQQEDEELLPGLITILEAANAHGWDVDPILDIYIPQSMEIFSGYEDYGNRIYYIKLLNQLAIYSLNKKRYLETINYILDYFTFAVNIDLSREFITSLSMYESVRSFASPGQQQRYNHILKGVLLNEKNINHHVSSPHII